MKNYNFIRIILQTWALLKWPTYYLQTTCHGFQVLKYAELSFILTKHKNLGLPEIQGNTQNLGFTRNIG